MGLSGRWRLEGRQLTVVLAKPLGSILAFRRRRVTLTAQCGEDTVAVGPSTAGPYPWAAVTGGRATAGPSARILRVSLAADLAGRTNLCRILIAALTSPAIVAELRAPMGVRRGRVVGCRPGPLEHVVLASAQILVTVAHAADPVTQIAGYRACLLPGGRLRPIDAAVDEGGGGGLATTAEQFTATGTWLAWVDGSLPHSDLGSERAWSMRLVDMTVGRPATIDGGPGKVTGVAVGPSGTVAWVDEPNPITVSPSTATAGPTFTYPAAELRAKRPGAATVVLDQTAPVTCPDACLVDTGVELANVVVSDDGRGITWSHAGLQRSAVLP